MSDHSGVGPDRPMHTGIELQRLPGGATIVRATGDLHGDAAAVLRRTFTDELTGSPELSCSICPMSPASIGTASTHCAQVRRWRPTQTSHIVWSSSR